MALGKFHVNVPHCSGSMLYGAPFDPTAALNNHFFIIAAKGWIKQMLSS